MHNTNVEMSNIKHVQILESAAGENLLPQRISEHDGFYRLKIFNKNT